MTPRSLPRLDDPIMAGCEHDAVRRLHRRHVGDAVLVAQRRSSVQPTVHVPPFLHETSTLSALWRNLQEAVHLLAAWSAKLSSMHTLVACSLHRQRQECTRTSYERWPACTAAGSHNGTLRGLPRDLQCQECRTPPPLPRPEWSCACTHMTPGPLPEQACAARPGPGRCPRQYWLPVHRRQASEAARRPCSWPPAERRPTGEPPRRCCRSAVARLLWAAEPCTRSVSAWAPANTTWRSLHA